MDKYFINLRDASVKDKRFSNLFNGNTIRLPFNRDEFSLFHRCATLWSMENKTDKEDDEWLYLYGKCSDMIYKKLDDFYSVLRDIFCFNDEQTPFVMWISWDIDNEIFDSFNVN